MHFNIPILIILFPLFDNFFLSGGYMSGGNFTRVLLSSGYMSGVYVLEPIKTYFTIRRTFHIF